MNFFQENICKYNSVMILVKYIRGVLHVLILESLFSSDDRGTKKFPGGGSKATDYQQADCSPELSTARRECEEETGYRVPVRGCTLIHTIIKKSNARFGSNQDLHSQFFFFSSCFEGEKREEDTQDGTINGSPIIIGPPRWIPVSQVFALREFLPNHKEALKELLRKMSIFSRLTSPKKKFSNPIYCPQ